MLGMLSVSEGGVLGMLSLVVRHAVVSGEVC